MKALQIRKKESEKWRKESFIMSFIMDGTKIM
jgi:hypothetical protein